MKLVVVCLLVFVCISLAGVPAGAAGSGDPNLCDFQYPTCYLIKKVAPVGSPSQNIIPIIENLKQCIDERYSSVFR